MTGEVSPADRAKSAAAAQAVQHIKSGMRVGLGTGSTAERMICHLGKRVREEGLNIRAAPTSARTADLARRLGIDLIPPAEAHHLDVTIDGADEFDPNLALIKGGGGALLHEKIVAAASERMIVIADASKEVSTLGAFPLPVEIIPFGWQSTSALIGNALEKINIPGREIRLRQTQNAPFVTDEGNHILDLHLHRIDDPRLVSRALNRIPGVVENGLFIDLCDTVIIGHADGRVETRDLSTGAVEQTHVSLAGAERLCPHL